MNPVYPVTELNMRLKSGFARIALSILFCFASCCANVSNAATSLPQPPVKPCANSIGMEFVLIPAGSFTMGADKNVDAYAKDDETPPHKVTITRPFCLGKYEVTQAQWEAVMGENPSKFKGENHPVELVSWNDVQTFIQRLNVKEGHTRYRLPTEAEWEYAARAGTTTKYAFGDDESQLGRYAWYDENSGGTTHPVGQKKPNPWGLYDMHGNVWEWVQDWHGENYYRDNPLVDPRGPSSGLFRALRGGGWNRDAALCRAAFRDRASPASRSSPMGFRLVLSVE